MARVLGMVSVCCLFLFLPSQVLAGNPTLVLQITVDQLRGDLPERFYDRLGKKGFRYLLDKGAHYTNAHYRHANTETAVGHATLVTGADPSRHGIVANSWIDATTGEFVYNTEDKRHRILGTLPKPHQGTSPHNLLASTIGDELVVATAGKSRVFSVSGKDRGAILPGGHAGKAFWYSKSSGDYVTSTYYYQQYPPWAAEWNQQKLADSFRGKQWQLLKDKQSYIAKDLDDRPFEANLKPLGRTFPHSYGDDKYIYLRLSLTPAGDQLTLGFAKALIDNEKLGQGEATDFLAVSFSSTDYIGHIYGPASLETEDNILRLDAVLAELFAHVDKKIGLKNTLVILSADHGAPEAPEHMASLGMGTGRYDFSYFREQGPLNTALKQRFGRDDLIANHSHLYLYLNLPVIAEAKLDVAVVEQFIAAELIKIPGIAYAQTRSDLLAGRTANSPVQQQIRRNFHPQRSGNIHMVQEQYWFLHSTDEAVKMGLAAIAAIHGSPWPYDTHVPILFAGHKVSAQKIHRRVSPTDIAPTIARYLGIKYPSGSVGDPLTEVFE